MILHDWKTLAHGLAICAACCATACCGKSTMMRAEQETTAGRAADVASRRTTESQQQHLQAAAAAQASQAQVGAVRGEAEPGPGSGEGNTLYLECGDEGPSFMVVIEAQRARLFLSEGEADLAQMPAGSGTKYTDGKIVLWTQGDAAIFEDADGRRYMCSNNPSLAVWQDATSVRASSDHARP